MEEALTAYLLADAAIEALAVDRITWVRRTQGAPLPAVVMHVIDAAPEYSDEGSAGIVGSRIQIDCWGDRYADAKLLARAVKARLSGLEANLSGVEFQGIFIDAERDFSESAAASQEPYCVSLDFITWHEE